MVKIGILSDCHLGARQFRKSSKLMNTYCDLNNKSFEEAVDTLIENNVDYIFIAGDLFDSPNPDIYSLRFANKVLNKLVDKNTPIYLLGGNHDYSQMNNNLSCHPFDLLENPNIIKVYNHESMFGFDVNDSNNLPFTLTMIPYKSMNYETFGRIYQPEICIDSNKNNKPNILMIHGCVDLNNMANNTNNDNVMQEYYLPKTVAMNYDFIICGHVHLPCIINNDNCKILTPGSLMPSNMANNYTFKPSVYIASIEADNNISIKSIHLQTPPNVLEIVTNDINHTLETIIDKYPYNDIVYIKYNGKIEDVDEGLYKKAFQKLLNLSLQTDISLDHLNTDNKENLGDFWDFIKNNHNEYYDEFKNIINTIIDKNQ